MSLNKYSSPKEVLVGNPAVNGRIALTAHLHTYYPNDNSVDLTLSELERRLTTLSTKAMETL